MSNKILDGKKKSHFKSDLVFPFKVLKRTPSVMGSMLFGYAF